MKLWKKTKEVGKTVYLVCGIEIFKKKTENNIKKYYLFGIRIFKKLPSSVDLLNQLNNSTIQISDILRTNNTLLNAANNIYNDLTAARAELDRLQYKMQNSIGHALTANSLHRRVFPKYQNINYGKDVVLVATGPSLNEYIPIKDAVHIGVNRAFRFEKVKFDYLFAQDYSGPTKDWIKDFIEYDNAYTKKFLGILPYTGTEIDKYIIPGSICIGTNIERYYVNDCNTERFTYDISQEAFGDSYSVAFPVMQFILWTNPKRIYLVGCDTSSSGHFDKGANSLFINRVLNGWDRLKKFADVYYPDTEIISINPIGLKGLFKDIYTRTDEQNASLLLEHYTELFKSEDYRTSFLAKHRDERMDAYRNDIFPGDRISFHLDRYFFASQFINNKIIIDVASGTGYGANFMASLSSPVKIYGVEIDVEAIAYAKSKYQRDNVEFNQGSIINIPFPDNFCDVLTSFETIEHAENENKQLQEVQRVLKPGGYYILSTPNRWGLTSHHVKDYDYDSVRELVSKYFTIEAIFNQNSGSSGRVENHEQPRKIVPTTQENHHLAECFIIVAKNTKDGSNANLNDKKIFSTSTFS
ncbi:MAG: methyltransferase domain-containing protein [Endomicrobia bacterium]|nr:methyltransferase domain-containing protein [Endomicrobiia bacterium]MCL2506256.1 methyltransferase domain-containing protein [Endomicrobiia bacterium]